MPSRTLQTIVVGAGPSGLLATCLLARRGVSAGLVGNPFNPDPRTVALMMPALRWLEEAGVWPGDLRPDCAALVALKIVDDTGSLFTAPSLVFSAQEAGLAAFGWNLPLDRLVPALLAQARRLGVTLIGGDCSAARCGEAAVDIEVAGVTWSAPLAIAADGRQSLLRPAAGIAGEAWSFDQVAIATRFQHSRPHRGISTEHHKAAGPCTTVPLPGGASSLVWMERPDRAARLMALDDPAFAAEIQAASHGDLGLVTSPGPRRLFAMQGVQARAMARNRVLLIGEAAHSMPPIGAQGLNTSVADAAAAASLVADAIAAGRDPGGPDVLSAYALARAGDVRIRLAAVSALNRSLLANSPLLDLARSLGLRAVASLPPLRRAAMRRGLGDQEQPAFRAPAAD